MRGIGLRLCDELIAVASVFDTPLIARLRSALAWRTRRSVENCERLSSSFIVQWLEMVHTPTFCSNASSARHHAESPIQQFLCLRLSGAFAAVADQRS